MWNRLKNKASGNLNIVLVLLIILLLAFISTRRFVRLDLTEDGRYTLSKTTKSALQTLDDVITVKVFFSKRLPPDLEQLAGQVRDTLDEYRSFAPSGLFDVQFLDPAEDEAVKNEAVSLGVPEVRMNFIKEDKVEAQNGFLGMGIFFEDRSEILPVVAQTVNLEYDLTAAIKKVTSGDVKTIGFLTGHKEYALFDDRFTETPKEAELGGLKDVLEKTYKVREVNTSTIEPIEGVSTLVIAGPKEALSSRDLYEIDQFVMNGGSVVWLLEGVEVTPTLSAVASNHGADALLKHYGFVVEKTLVKDAIHETASFSQGFISFIVPYPLWPKLVKENFVSTNPIVASLDSLVLPWASPVTIVDDKEGVSLATTSNKAFTVGAPFNLDPNDQTVSGKQEKLTMVAFKNGVLKSFYDGKPIPEVKGKDEDLEDEEKIMSTEKNKEEGRTTKLASENPVRMIVVGNARFITDRMAREFPQNLNFIQNAIDYVTLDASLIEIRSKIFSDKPLNELSSTARNTLKFMVIFAVPILVGAGGAIKSWVRRRAKNKILAL